MEPTIMRLSKSYKLLRFLNRHHTWIIRMMLGSIAYVTIIILTQSQVLAANLYKAYLADNFKFAFRKTAWYLSKSFLKLHSINDYFFDFTENSDINECIELEKFIKNRRTVNHEHRYLADYLYIQARMIHNELQHNKSDISKKVDQFYKNANLLVQQLDRIRIPVTKQSSQERVGDFSAEDAQVALEDFTTLLPLNIWPWYAISGTFLGIHREGGFLAHDYDIDFGINFNHKNFEEIITIFNNSEKFIIKKIDYHEEIVRNKNNIFSLKKHPALIKLIHSTGINVDLFIHHKTENKVWHGSIIHRWENDIFNLKKYTLNGVELYGPDNADKYLTENYGNWREPVRDFDCTTGTPNLVIAKNFLSLALFLKKVTVLYETDRKQAYKLMKTLSEANIIIKKNESRLIFNEYI